MFTGRLLSKNKQEDLKMKKKISQRKIFLSIFSIMVVLVGGLVINFIINQNLISAENDVTVLENEENIVAIVNDEKITIEELDEFIHFHELIMTLYEIDYFFVQFLTSTEAGEEFLNEYRKWSLDDLIMNKLLEQEAKNIKKITSNEERDTIFQEHLEMVEFDYGLNEEQLLLILQQDGITSLDHYQEVFFEHDGFVALIQYNLFKDIIIEDNEIEELYNLYYKGTLAFEEVKEDLKHELLWEKQDNIWFDFLDNLWENADFEITI